MPRATNQYLRRWPTAALACIIAGVLSESCTRVAGGPCGRPRSRKSAEGPTGSRGGRKVIGRIKYADTDRCRSERRRGVEGESVQGDNRDLTRRWKTRPSHARPHHCGRVVRYHSPRYTGGGQGARHVPLRLCLANVGEESRGESVQGDDRDLNRRRKTRPSHARLHHCGRLFDIIHRGTREVVRARATRPYVCGWRTSARIRGVGTSFRRIQCARTGPRGGWKVIGAYSIRLPICAGWDVNEDPGGIDSPVSRLPK